MENKNKIFLFLYPRIRKGMRREDKRREDMRRKKAKQSKAKQSLNSWTSKQNEIPMRLHPVSPRSQTMKYFIVCTLSRQRDLWSSSRGCLAQLGKAWCNSSVLHSLVLLSLLG